MIRIVDYEDWGGGPAPIAEHFKICWQDEHDSAENATASAYMMSMLDEISDESLTWIKREEATLLVAIQQTDGSDGILVGTLVFITPSGIDSPKMIIKWAGSGGSIFILTIAGWGLVASYCLLWNPGFLQVNAFVP
ncbi:hypothetical protein LMG33818_001973 [Halomonadaceae bacterium LMG 33818]|uniref:hypothetical protein n=1 Tax=Cernens ardua TaxID=3402176 RepID=UPI003EDC7A1C